MTKSGNGRTSFKGTMFRDPGPARKPAPEAEASPAEAVAPAEPEPVAETALAAEDALPVEAALPAEAEIAGPPEPSPAQAPAGPSPDAKRYDPLYRETVRLAAEARGWFDKAGRELEARSSPEDRCAIATESLAITARLMAAIAFVLHPSHIPGFPLGLPGAPAPIGRFNLRPELPFADNHPLTGTPGGAIALASRRLVEKLETI